MGCIAAGRLLEYLGLGRCHDVDPEAMQLLTSVEWPLLKHLCIGVIGCADAQTLGPLACGSWSLHSNLHSLSLSV